MHQAAMSLFPIHPLSGVCAGVISMAHVLFSHAFFLQVSQVSPTQVSCLPNQNHRPIQVSQFFTLTATISSSVFIHLVLRGRFEALLDTADAESLVSSCLDLGGQVGWANSTTTPSRAQEPQKLLLEIRRCSFFPYLVI